MSKWCIVSNEALTSSTPNDLTLPLISGTCDIGVSHDGKNRVFTSVPEVPEGLEDKVVYVEANEETNEIDLVMEIGKFMKEAHTDKVLMASRHVFSLLFQSPIHKLWCGNYEDKKQLQADYKLVFGVDDLDGRKSLETLKVEAREAIYNLIP